MESALLLRSVTLGASQLSVAERRDTGLASDVGGKPVNSDLAPEQQLLSVAMPLCATEGTLVGLGFTHARPFGLSICITCTLPLS